MDWHCEIMAGGYQAVIFDCDGTLVDSGEAHFQSLKTALQAQGQELDRSWYAQRTGLDRRSLLLALSGELSAPLDITLAARHSIAAFVNAPNAVSSIMETARLVRRLRPSHPMAVATNAEIEVAEASLHYVGLLDHFTAIASISDDLPAKPAPNIFVHAAQKLGASIDQTLIFEDSPQGVTAAIAAGSDVIQVIHS